MPRALRRRDVTIPRLEQLSGRKNVLLTPRKLKDECITLISGHHGFVGYGENRVVLDSSGGNPEKPLSVMLWPQEMVLSDETGEWIPLRDVAVELTRSVVNNMKK